MTCCLLSAIATVRPQIANERIHDVFSGTGEPSAQASFMVFRLALYRCDFRFRLPVCHAANCFRRVSVTVNHIPAPNLLCAYQVKYRSFTKSRNLFLYESEPSSRDHVSVHRAAIEPNFKIEEILN